MTLHLREFTLAFLIAGTLVTSLVMQRAALAVFAGVILLLGLGSLLQLRRIPFRRAPYYFIVPGLLLFGIWLAAQPVEQVRILIVGGTSLVPLLYLLFRSLKSRRTEPKADVPLHHNAYLASVWVAGFLSILGLYQIQLEAHLPLAVPIVGGIAVSYLLSQSLAFFFLIPPWLFRGESLVAAFVAGEFLLASSFWFTTPFFTAALVMVALYLFWGIAYHQRKELLTRRLLYEYGIVTLAITIFLLSINPWRGGV